jgi:hypothetical protein
MQCLENCCQMATLFPEEEVSRRRSPHRAFVETFQVNIKQALGPYLATSVTTRRLHCFVANCVETRPFSIKLPTKLAGKFPVKFPCALYPLYTRYISALYPRYLGIGTVSGWRGAPIARSAGGPLTTDH